MSQQAAYMGAPRDAVDLARGARTLAEREGLSALMAEASVMEAHGHARAGNSASCAAGLGAAEIALTGQTAAATRTGSATWMRPTCRPSSAIPWASSVTTSTRSDLRSSRFR